MKVVGQRTREMSGYLVQSRKHVILVEVEVEDVRISSTRREAALNPTERHRDIDDDDALDPCSVGERARAICIPLPSFDPPEASKSWSRSSNNTRAIPQHTTPISCQIDNFRQNG